ncbi:MAG: phospholipase D-like domain-containing protein [Woeseia sp.]
MQQIGITLLALSVLLFASLSAAHALLYKRDTRAVIAWVGLIILVPLAGAILYWLLGVNRVRRRAAALRQGLPATRRGAPSALSLPPGFAPLARAGDQLGPFDLCGGNRVEPLENGDEAFPAMLEAINGANVSIALATYIFDNDAVGAQFADALTAAQRRGVEVRVLIDAVGQHYSWRSMTKRLRSAGIVAAAFMPVLKNMVAFNLRNHRKLLVVDGSSAFTGGMNIRAGNVLAAAGRHPVRDLQFRVAGPAVAQLMDIFVHDWEFTTGEKLDGEDWFPPLRNEGAVIARAIPDGPAEHFEVLKLMMLAALAQAKESVSIVTPYFLPDASLITALNTTALRGVAVNILLPEKNNLKLVQWASHTIYWQVLQRGCRIWHSPPPFDHSKLMLVDDQWLLVGSTNWDPRSLRLNFELNLECYDASLAASMSRWFDHRLCRSREIRRADIDRHRLPRRLRDGAARLLSPYL